MRLLNWLKNLLAGQRLRYKVDTAYAKLQQLEETRKVGERKLRGHRKELRELQDQTSRFQTHLDDTLQSALDLQKQYKEELEIARSELKIMQESTVPTLIAQNEMLLSMWEAETAIHVRRQVVNQPREE